MHAPHPKLLDSEWLYQKYINEELSMHTIATELGVTVSVVSKYIRRYQFPVRPGGLSKTLTSRRRGPSDPLLANREWLYQKYVVELLGLRDIARLAGRSSRCGIKQALLFHNIPVRDLAKARTARADKGPELRDIGKPEANDLDHIRALYESGKSIDNICIELDVSKDAMRHRFKVANIQARDPWVVHIGTNHSQGTRMKMSFSASQQIMDGTRRGHAYGRRINVVTPHDGFITVRSRYEKEYAEFLNENKIDYFYERMSFPLSSGKSYVPDFYLPDSDEYIETKGWLNDNSRQKYELFQQEYPQIKWSIKYKEDLEAMGLTLNKTYPTVYLLCGVAGSGKSWIASQLTDLFHYISFDGVRKKDHIDTILAQSSDKPVLFDPNIKISTFIRRNSYHMNIIPVFILEDEATIQARLEGRGGKFTEHIPKRMKVMEARYKTYGRFRGNTNEVLEWLKNEAVTIEVDSETNTD